MNQQTIDDFGVEYVEDVLERSSMKNTQTRLSQPQQIVEEKSFIEQIDPKRQILRTGARIGETLVGLPGDVRDVVKMGGGWLLDKARGFIGKDPLNEEQKTLTPGIFDLVGNLVESLPTSENLKENITRKYTGEYLEPSNEYERFSDNVASDFAALALPVKGKIPFARSLGQSIIANSGGEVAKEFGGDKAEAYTKLGLLFGMGLASGGKKGGVKKYINGLYNEMESTIPEGAQVSTKQLSKELDQIEAILKKGDPGASSKQPAFKKIDSLKNKIKSGEIDVDELVQFNKDINESIYSLGELKRGQNQLYNIREAVHDTLGQYGKQNPDFMKSWKNANEAYAATETSRKVGNWIRKNVSVKDYIYAATALGLEGIQFGLPATLSTIGAGAALGSTAYTAEVMKRIAKSPALRKYYTNVVTNSLKNNKAGLTRAMKQLNSGLENSFKEEPFETVSFEEEVEN